MFAVVAQVDPARSIAFLNIPGYSKLVPASFDEIVNAHPRTLDIGETVSCIVKPSGDFARATQIKILYGNAELDALRKVVSSQIVETARNRRR